MELLKKKKQEEYEAEKAVNWKVGILTISDSIFHGVNEDKSGLKAVSYVKQQWKDKVEIITHLVPDEMVPIQNIIKEWTDTKKLHLILSTGGTGLAPRDITPEATKPLLDKEAPGIIAAMLNKSLSVTPFAMLGRPLAGIRDKTLIINLPGNPKAIDENLDAIFDCLPHALSLILELPNANAGHRKVIETKSENEAQTPRQLDPNFHKKSENNSHSHSHSHDHSHSHSHSNFQEVVGNRNRDERGSKYEMIPVNEAIDIILKETENSKPIRIPFDQALGCILNTDIYSPEPMPPFEASIKDGYAVNSESGKGKYEVKNTVTAGNEVDFEVKIGTVAKIMTGSPLPKGTDAVVMIENTELVETNKDGSEKIVNILVDVKPGTDIRPIGSDIKQQELILQKGTRLLPSEIGLLATVGITEVEVLSGPIISVLSSGDELVEPNQPISKGKIRDSNRSTLLAAIKSFDQNWGTKSIDLGIAKDKDTEIEEQILNGLKKSDILISSGGVSMGDLDLIKPFLEKHGKVHFGRILMKPGKPCTFATLQIDGKKKFVFALPGNPVSSITLVLREVEFSDAVCFHLMVLPCLKKMAGYQNPYLPEIQAKIFDELTLDPYRPEYHRAYIEWDNSKSCFVAYSTGKQSSSRLLSMKSANGLLVLPQKSGKFASDSTIPGTSRSLPCTSFQPFYNYTLHTIVIKT